MLTKGRTVAIAIVALCLGFVGGAWFFGSGMAFQFMPPPAIEPASAMRKAAGASSKAPRVKVASGSETAGFSDGEAGLGPVAERTDLKSALGSPWVIEPRPFRLGAAWQRTDAERALAGDSALEPGSGGLDYVLVQSTTPGTSVITLRPVFFDNDANRHVPTRSGASSSSSTQGRFSVTRFALAPARSLAPDKIAYFGIELVVPNEVELLAAAAQQEAREKGIEILPFPVLGKPYVFDLAAPGGKRLRATDFRGKAVLIVVWNPGLGGRYAMSVAKQIRESNKPEELAIIGLSFEGSVEEARKTFAGSGADGPIAVIPNDPLSRRLWRDGAGFAHSSWFYLIDRDGILRTACNNSWEAKGLVDMLFGRPRPLTAAQRNRSMSRTRGHGAPAINAPRSPAVPRPGT